MCARAFFAEENRVDYAEIPKCLSSSSIRIDILFLLFVLLSKGGEEEKEEKKPQDDVIKRLEGSCV